MIDEAGQNVTIRRPGHADVTSRAVLYQEDSKGEGQVGNPEFKVVGWQGVFKSDAPLTLPFVVVDAHGQMFTPTAPPQNPGGQDVALIVHLLPLTDRTRVEQLVFTLPGTGTVRDKNGNPVPAPGPKLPVPARLVASQDPRIRDMVGADTADVVLVGRWGTLEKPLLKPDGLKWGMTSPLVLDGQNGTLTLKIAYPDPDLAQEMQFGARFLAIWRANS